MKILLGLLKPFSAFFELIAAAATYLREMAGLARDIRRSLPLLHEVPELHDAIERLRKTQLQQGTHLGVLANDLSTIRHQQRQLIEVVTTIRTYQEQTDASINALIRTLEARFPEHEGR